MSNYTNTVEIKISLGFDTGNPQQKPEVKIEIMKATGDSGISLAGILKNHLRPFVICHMGFSPKAVTDLTVIFLKILDALGSVTERAVNNELDLPDDVVARVQEWLDNDKPPT